MKKRMLSLLAALSLMLPAGFAGVKSARADELPYGLPDLDITSDVVTYLTWDSQKSMEKDAANLLMQEVYGCKLKVVRTTYTELTSKATNMTLSNSSADLIKYRDQDVRTFITNGVVEDMSQYIDFDSALYAAVKDEAYIYADKGRVYAVPVNEIYNDNYLYYWTSFFEDQGLETPWELYQQGDWNFTALRELMKDLTIDEDRDGIVDTYALVLHPGYSYLICGEDFVTYDAETGMYGNNLRSPKLAEYFEFLYNTGTAGDNTRLMSQQDLTCFAAKNAVMMLGASWTLGAEYYQDILDGRMGVAPAPHLDSNDVNYVRGRVDYFWVGKNASNINGALAYLACCRALEENEGLADELKARAGLEVIQWPEEIQAILDEMNDPEKFTIMLPWFTSVGTWADDTFGYWNLTAQITEWEVPWQNIVEQQYPLLQDSINQVNGAYSAE